MLARIAFGLWAGFSMFCLWLIHGNNIHNKYPLDKSYVS